MILFKKLFLIITFLMIGIYCNDISNNMIYINESKMIEINNEIKVIEFELKSPYNFRYLFENLNIMINNSYKNDIDIYYGYDLNDMINEKTDIINIELDDDNNDNNIFKKFISIILSWKKNNKILYSWRKDDNMNWLLDQFYDLINNNNNNNNKINNEMTKNIQLSYYGITDFLIFRTEFIYPFKFLIFEIKKLIYNDNNKSFINRINELNIIDKNHNIKSYLLIKTNEKVTITINYNINSINYFNISLLIIGIILFLFSDFLSSSIRLYLCFCFLGGSIFSLLTVVIFLFYLLSKQIKIKNWLVNIIGFISLAISGKVSLIFFSDWKSIINNNYILIILLIGGIIGFIIGYKKTLSDKQKDLINIGLKFTGIILIIYSIHLYEISLLLILLISNYFNFIPIFIILVICRYSFNLIKKIFKRKKKEIIIEKYNSKYVNQISLEEYENQSIYTTKKGLNDLLEHIRNCPSKLSLLKGENLEIMKKFVSGEDYLNIILFNSKLQPNTIENDENKEM
jgi:hypothetical protein